MSPIAANREGEGGADPGADRLLAFLILLPALVLAWPGPSNPIAGDFATTELSATGVALLCSLPAGLLSAWRRPRPPRAFFLLLLAWLALSLHPGQTETLQGDRAWMGLLVGLLLALAAGTLGSDGRTWLARGMALVCLLLVGRALLDRDSGWAGVLGNTGELSGAALPGALCGLYLWARCRSGWRWVGMLAAALFWLHAFVAPVLASLVVLAAVGGAGLWFLRGSPERTARIRLLLTSALALLGLVWTQVGPALVPSPTTRDAAPGVETPPATSGGVAVRLRVWAATLPMIADHPFAGVGAGQFAAAFPPYRDPEEIERSTFQRRIEFETEVEHPHNDWLSFFAEGGIAGGLAWCAFLWVVAAAAVRRQRGSTPVDAALAAGALATVIGALVNAPLTFNPAASTASFAFFGAVLASGGPAPRRRFGGLLAPAVAIAAVLYVPRAHSMWRLGTRMAEFGGASLWTDRERAVDDALDTCPDSVVALTLKARILSRHRDDLRGALERWERVLALRPHRFEALQNSGVLHARLGELGVAGELFDRALEIDPGHPGLIRSRIFGFAQRGRIEQALAEVDRLEATGHYRALDLLHQGSKLILGGQDREGLALLARADRRFEDLPPEGAWALDAEYRASGDPLAADAFKAVAHLMWGREHAAAGRWEDARRSYRQNLRVVRDYVPEPGPVRLRMELAAVLWQARQREDAEALLEGLEPKIHDWIAMPDWAGQTLIDLGFGVEKH